LLLVQDELVSKLISEIKEFEFTEQHMKLLKNMWVGWQDCEFGAPEIDPKNPYGNSSVELDLAEILEVPIVEWDTESIPASTRKRLNELHKETETALQILLQHGYKLGVYQSANYSNRWDYVG
jgi:hypothetical protein